MCVFVECVCGRVHMGCVSMGVRRVACVFVEFK